MVAFEVPEVDYTQYSNRQLIAIPLVVLALALGVLAVTYAFTGSPVALGNDFTGGSELKVQSSEPISEQQATDIFGDSVVSVQQVSGQDQYIITFDNTAEVSELTTQAEQTEGSPSSRAAPPPPSSAGRTSGSRSSASASPSSG